MQSTGAIGLFAIAGAKLSGAGRIVAIGGPKDRLTLAREFWADVTIDIAEASTPELRRELVYEALDSNRGASAVIGCIVALAACAAPAPASEAAAPAAEAESDASGGAVTIRGLVNQTYARAWMAEAGLLADLSQFEGFNSPEYDVADFHPSPLANGEWEGVQYGVPVRANLLLMFYNRTLFEQAGLNADEVLAGVDWAGFEDLLAQLARDTNGDGQNDVWGFGTQFARETLAPTRWQTILNSNGGQLFDENLKPIFNTPEGAAALQNNLSWMKYGPPGIEAMGFNEMNEAFRQGKLAVMFNWGSVFRATAVDPESTTLTPDQVGISAMPGGSACDLSAHRGVYAAVIPEKAKHKNEGWEFVQWLTSKEGEQFSSAELGQFPARMSTLTGEPPQEWLGPVFKAILDGYEGIQCGQMWRPRLPDSDGVSQILATHHSRAVLGEVTPEQALNDAAAEIEQFLSEKGYYD